MKWKAGFHPPAGVEPEDVAAEADKLVQAGREPSPENMLEGSKDQSHVLHRELWSEGDQVWAHRGRLDRVRRIMGSVVKEVTVKNRTVEIRSFEYVGTKSDGRWHPIERILDDQVLADAYLAEIVRMQMEAAGKLENFRTLRRAKVKEAARDTAGHGKAGQARPGGARQGVARRGVAGPGWARQAWLGRAGQGGARQGRRG